MYKNIIRPLLFLFNPETIHNLAVLYINKISRIPGLTSIIRRIYHVNDQTLQTNVSGLEFENPVGVAAGFDKDALMVDGLAAFGFGFVEIGTVTPSPQPGNPKPRLFRLPDDGALINRMGFNNKGAEKAARHLSGRKTNIIIGGNIGKNKITPNEQAVEDYIYCLDQLYDYADYFVVNVSSPNTPGLRELQEKKPLMKILQALKKEIREKGGKKPLYLKIAPDLSEDQLNDIIEIVNDLVLEGVVATNTTVAREGLQSPDPLIQKIGEGGLSGRPLKKRSSKIIRYLRQRLHKEAVIIGVGGIMSVEDALEKIEAGADLIQLYTGFVYEGPGLVKRINNALIRRRKSKTGIETQ